MEANSGGVSVLNCYTYSGAEIGLFYADSYLTFQGLVQIKVIAGLVNLFGHTFQPSPSFYDAYPLSTQFKLTVVSADQATTLAQKEYAQAVASMPLMFRQAENNESLGKSVVDVSKDSLLYLEVGLNQTDCMQISSYLQQHSLLSVYAVVVFRELRNNITEVLLRCFPLYCHGNQTWSSASKNFIIGGSCRKVLEVPSTIGKAISSLVNQKDLVILLMGQVNTGKSTVARYTINSLLNQHRKVAFLECDIGQTEFTPSGVVSLTHVSEPVIGPPCTHQQCPERAYLVGDKSPMQEPDLYVCCISSLMQYFIGQKESMPLVVNTCGWLKDLGTCLFWDLLRLINPTHVIYLQAGCQKLCRQDCSFRMKLASISASDCHRSLGWLLTPPSSHVIDQLHPTEQLSGEGSTHEGPLEGDFKPPETIRPSSDGPSYLDTGEAISAAGTSTIKQRRKFKLTSRKLKPRCRKLFTRRIKCVHITHQTLRKRKAICKKYLHQAMLPADLSKGLLRTGRHGQYSKVTQSTTGWTSCGQFQLLPHSTVSSSQQTSSRELREMAMAVYFAQLNNVASKFLLWPEVMIAAVPYEIKWHQLAVHCLTVEVPRSQIFYALNGMVVGLTRVDPSIIMDFESSYPGMVKFLSERMPMAEYLGYGLVRGIDMEKKVFYITTPEPADRLEQVNCLMISKNELPSRVYACSKKHYGNSILPYVCGDLPQMGITRIIQEHPI